MWTGAILSKVIEQRFEVQLKDSRIYELLSELGLSYQRAHRDYANADPQAQREWVAAVKKTGCVAKIGSGLRTDGNLGGCVSLLSRQ